jgi:hypothetical protein
MVPVTKDAVNDVRSVELRAESVQHSTAVNAQGREGCLVGLEHVSAYGRFHGQVHNGIKLDGLFVNLNWLKGPWDKQVVCHCGRGVHGGHGDDRRWQTRRIKCQQGSAKCTD